MTRNENELIIDLKVLSLRLIVLYRRPLGSTFPFYQMVLQFLILLLMAYIRSAF